MNTLRITCISAAFLLCCGSAQADLGSTTYKQACFSCHGTGAGGAPKIGDKAAWKPRIAKGIDTLYQAGLNGIPDTAMIPRGGLAQLPDDAVKAAVDFMVKNSQ